MKFQVVLVAVVLVAVVAGKKGCKYDKGQWGPCDQLTNEMKRTMTLKEAKEGCEATMEQTRECKQKRANCKYTKGSWGECDTTTNMRSRSMTLRRGDPECAQTSTQTISCEKYDQIYKMKDEKKKARELMKAEKRLIKDMQKKLKELHKMGCTYTEEVSECNQETQKVRKTFTFSGDINTCVMDPVEISCTMQDKFNKIKQRKEQLKSERKNRKNKKDKKRNHKRGGRQG
ncbi:midkine-like [Mytilus trossulus]|uniref:midkine-like n=1 Tax=Mytilus trossulus TaxID=6551 RepID=UPI003007DA23